MKTFTVFGLFTLIVFSSFSQPAKTSLVASLSGEDRIALARTSIQLTEFHERSFWNQYENYQNKCQELTGQMYTALAEMAGTDKSINDKQAFDVAQKVIYYRHEQLPLWQKYYAEIGSAHNGIIALQFLQTEVLLDMLESARIYEETPLKQYRFHAMEDPTTNRPIDKHKVLSAALALSKAEEEVFFKIYAQYEHECDDLFGEDYSLIGNYAVEPYDYTPGQAQLIGFNLLELMRREIKLKEKYFAEMNTAMGSSIATRFLAWEDYYSLVSKMESWADAP